MLDYTGTFLSVFKRTLNNIRSVFIQSGEIRRKQPISKTLRWLLVSCCQCPT